MQRGRRVVRIFATVVPPANDVYFDIHKRAGGASVAKRRAAMRPRKFYQPRLASFSSSFNVLSSIPRMGVPKFSLTSAMSFASS